MTVGGSAASASIDDMNLVVHLPSALAPNATVDVTIRYTARFNSTNPNRKWLFAERHGIVTAYRWIPWLSNRYPFKTPLFGDAFATQIASRVDVSLTTDRAGMIYAAPGTRTSVSGNTQTFVAYNVRDFNFSGQPVLPRDHRNPCRRPVRLLHDRPVASTTWPSHAKQAFDKYTLARWHVSVQPDVHRRDEPGLCDGIAAGLLDPGQLHGRRRRLRGHP